MKDPHFHGGFSFFTKVETGEGKAACGSYGMLVSCDGGGNVVSGDDERVVGEVEVDQKVATR